jgi:hypothetical protein
MITAIQRGGKFIAITSVTYKHPYLLANAINSSSYPQQKAGKTTFR